uniref:Uncharacterized protein n=1 Tax=Manihot esculenta TaxID=3983 RepID=A0A2C9VEN6_MANES
MKCPEIYSACSRFYTVENLIFIFNHIERFGSFRSIFVGVHRMCCILFN